MNATLAIVPMPDNHNAIPETLVRFKPSTSNHNAHSGDFATVRWNGTVYTLTPKQRIVIAILWQAAEEGLPYVGGHYLLERADSDQSRLSLVFRDSPAWRKLIVPGELHDGPSDTYCLAPPSDPTE
jgi:hypothetical protein